VRIEVKKNAESREGMVEHMERRLKEDLGVRVASNSSMKAPWRSFTNFGKEARRAAFSIYVAKHDRRRPQCNCLSVTQSIPTRAE